MNNTQSQDHKDSIAMADVIDGKPTAVCPWQDPTFVMSPDEPCPVCGAYGDMSAFDKCIG